MGDTAWLKLGRAPELRPERADLVALERQVVAEAQAATDRHGLRPETAEPTLIDVWDGARLERDGGEAVLEVGDRGVGIPAEDVPRIFERYFRAGTMAGSGLGLAGTRQAVEGHGGTIAAASEAGEGSVFTVRLPLGDDREA